MSKLDFDPMDTALIAVVAFSAAVMAGLGTFSVFGVSLSQTFTTGGATFSYAYLATAAAFGATILTNEASLSELQNRAERDLDEWYYYALLAAVAGLVAWPFVSGLQTFVTSQDLWGVLFIAASVGAQVAIGYIR